jgi:drug/metabolite transporter (DMT)-like permease
MKANPQSQQELTSFGYGFLGVLIFSLTLPATRIAVSGFDPVFVGLGRAIVAAGLSLILLLVTGQTIPPLKFLPNFAIVAAGVVVGFPLLSAIALLPIVWQHIPSNFSTVPLNAGLGFIYVSVFSMFLGFFAWYRGLALGGVARIGQIQLIQPFLTILASVLLLGEPLSIETITFAVAVIGCVILGKRTQILTTAASPNSNKIK